MKTSSSLYPPLTFPARFFTAAPGTLVERNANDLWCADFQSEFKLGNGRYCYPLTVTDHAGQFSLAPAPSFLSEKTNVTTDESPYPVRVRIIIAGPVGLLLTALLQTNERFSVCLYEKRREYTRTVQLAPYLVADSVASYCTDYIDEESSRAIFDPSEIHAGLAFRQSFHRI